MIKKLFAWTLLILVSFGVFYGVKHWKSPWAAMSAPVLDLPKLGPGCGDKCK